MMRETVVETHGPAGAPAPDDVVAGWRGDWERSVAEAAESGDARLVARRRDYGSYVFAIVDLVAALIGAFILSIPLVLLVTALYLGTGHTMSTPAGQKGYQGWLLSPQVTFAGLLVTDGAIVAVLWYRLTRLRERWSLFGLGKALRVGPTRAVLIGLGLGVVAIVSSAIIAGVTRKLGFNTGAQDKLLIEPLRSAPWWIAWAVALAGTFVAPVAEELLFRGYIFRAIAARRGGAPAYLFSALAFGLYHLSSGLALLPIVPALFVVGLLLCFAYHRTGNLLTDITAHALNNGVAFFAALVLHQS